MDCSPPGSSVQGIFQARILERVAISYSREIFLTQGSNLHPLPLLLGTWILYHRVTWGTLQGAWISLNRWEKWSPEMLKDMTKVTASECKATERTSTLPTDVFPAHIVVSSPEPENKNKNLHLFPFLTPPRFPPAWGKFFLFFFFTVLQSHLPGDCIMPELSGPFLFNSFFVFCFFLIRR